jgi:hypothetical protein
MTQPATNPQPPQIPSQIGMFTEEQMHRLIEAVQNSNGGRGPRRVAGLGAAPLDLQKSKGLGAPYDCQSDAFITMDVYQMLRLGSPRLALAKAWGVPFAPYYVNCRATFPTVATTYIPAVSNDQKIVQDTYVNAITGVLTNLSSTANQSSLQTLTDYFYNQQNGMNVTLDVQGAPRYSIAPSPTPVGTLADMLGSGSQPGNGWILTYQQQLVMNFQANIPLPTAPYELCMTFQGWVPRNDMFIDMRNRDAVAQLRAEGYFVPDSYLDNVVR